MTAPVAMADNQALLDPMHALTAGERTMLRKLAEHGPAVSVGFRKGWMLGGTRYKDAALYRFLDIGLARCWKDTTDGAVKIACTYTGQLAADRITPSKPQPAVAPPDDD